MDKSSFCITAHTYRVIKMTCYEITYLLLCYYFQYLCNGKFRSPYIILYTAHSEQCFYALKKNFKFKYWVQLHRGNIIKTMFFACKILHIRIWTNTIKVIDANERENESVPYYILCKYTRLMLYNFFKIFFLFIK